MAANSLPQPAPARCSATRVDDTLTRVQRRVHGPCRSSSRGRHAAPQPGPGPRPGQPAGGTRRGRPGSCSPAADPPPTCPTAAQAAVRVTADPGRFRDILLAERPRIVVVCQPPARDEDLDLVASERRRRSRLRVLHLAPPGAVADRIAALARGFDDALTTATTSGELAARLAWLEARAPRTSCARGQAPGRPGRRAGRGRSRGPTGRACRAPSAEGVRPAGAHGLPPRPRVHPPRAPRARVGEGPRERRRGPWMSTSAGSARRSRPTRSVPSIS